MCADQTGWMLCCLPSSPPPRRPDSPRTRVFRFLQNTVGRIPRPDAISSPSGQKERVLHRLTVRERERKEERGEREKMMLSIRASDLQLCLVLQWSLFEAENGSG